MAINISQENKLRIVEEIHSLCDYSNKKYLISSFSKKYNIPKASLTRWYNRYLDFGKEGILGYRSGRTPEPEQLCWGCVNAVPNKKKNKGCPWSMNFEPVPGWTAKFLPQLKSYDIRECPLFIHD